MLTVPELESQLKSATSRQARIDSLNALAWAIHLNDQERARSLAEQSFALSSGGESAEIPYPLGLAGSLRVLAALNDDAGRYDLALTQSLRALEILGGIPEDQPDAGTLRIELLGIVSWTHRSLGDYGVAAEHALEALKLAQAREDRWHEAGMLNILSVIYAESNNLAAALEIGHNVLRLCREEDNARGESIVLNNLAMTYHELGQGEQALEACLESLRIARDHGIDAVALTALSTMGEVYLGLGNHAKAEEILLQALALSREHQAGSDELQCLLNLGKAYQRQNNVQAALSALHSALAISRASNDRRDEYQCHQLLSEVHEKNRAYEAALYHFRQFHAIKETVFNEGTAKRLAGLQVLHQVETAKRDAEIHYLKTIELKREIEERKSAQTALEKLAGLDPLTGVLNRREFFMLGRREVERAAQAGHPLSVILLDLDHLKQINDTHGHATGDQALLVTARTARESLRLGDVIGRYGGDEFVVLLPGSNGAQGKQIAERLCENIAAHAIATGKGNLVATLSLGIAELDHAAAPTLEALLSQADQALYQAKRAGRNQIAVYTSSLASPALPAE
jgi:diguanylate cyclase (GGDEF)-like protein